MSVVCWIMWFISWYFTLGWPRWRYSDHLKDRFKYLWSTEEIENREKPIIWEILELEQTLKLKLECDVIVIWTGVKSALSRKTSNTSSLVKCNFCLLKYKRIRSLTPNRFILSTNAHVYVNMYLKYETYTLLHKLDKNLFIDF